MATAGETERVRRFYDGIADKYDRFIPVYERVFVGDGRRWVCSQARGDVLEIGVGTGRNFPYYPLDVRLTGIDLSSAMLEVARRRAQELGRDVDLRVGDAQALDFPDDRFETVLSTFALCTIPDDARAVAEVRRVLRPGGRFLLLEHVRSPHRPVRAVQRALNPLFVRFAADHLLREPLDIVRAKGFQLEELERAKWGIVERLAARRLA